jgi:AbrB family looped-hinge helix DNA binding protein
MQTIKINRRGQITIPRRIRKQVGLQNGDSVALIPVADGLILRPLTQTLFDLRGSIPVTCEQDFEQIRKKFMQARPAGDDRSG